MFLQVYFHFQFPRLEQKNVQFWFKNRRAKCKRMNITGGPSSSEDLATINQNASNNQVKLSASLSII